ncbi:MAG TPA: hypothetical protein PLZ98_02700 [Chitinophagaceae bacterium]|jgi:myosin heavy subunit|nr:hypothetical protein [Chitinophagaceae bacterium]
MRMINPFIYAILIIALFFTKASAQDLLIKDTVYFNIETATMTIDVPVSSLRKSYFSPRYTTECILQKINVRNNKVKVKLDNTCDKPFKLPFTLFEMEFVYNDKDYSAEIYCVYKDISITELQIRYGSEYNKCDLIKKLNNFNIENIQSKEELVLAKKVQENTLDEIKENQEKIKALEKKNKEIEKERVAKEEKKKKEEMESQKEKEKEQKEKEKKIADAEKKKNQADAEVKQLNKQVSELNNQIEELRKENEKISSNKEEKSKKEKKRIEEENQLNEKRLDSMRTYMASLNSRIGNEQRKIADFVDEINDLKSENENLTKETVTLKAQLESQKAENQKLADQVNALKIQTEKLLEDYKQKEEFVKEATKKFSITSDEDIKRSEGKATYNSELRELPLGYEGQYLKEEYSVKAKYLELSGEEDFSLSKYSITQDCMTLTLKNIYFDADASYFRFSIENACPYEFQTGVTLLSGEFASGQQGVYDKIRPRYMNFPILFPKSGGKADVKDFIYVAPQKLWMRDESDLYIKVKDRKAKWNIELGFPFEVYRKKLEAYEKQ